MSSDADDGAMQDAGRRSVLLVEDDEDNRELMAEVLEAAGHEVVAVSSGAAALRAISDRRLDVVVTDVGMPGVSGLEVARAAKAAASPVPVIVVTGYSERDDITSARGHEIDAVLVKPIDPDTLVDVVGRVLARTR